MEMLLLGVIALIVGAATGAIGGGLSVYSGYQDSLEEQSDIERAMGDQKESLDQALTEAELSWEKSKKAAGEQADDWLYQAGLLKEDSLEYEAQSGALGVKTTKDESILSTVYNQAIKDIQLTAEKNQLSNQIASVEQGKSTGSALAGMAKSGIRSGSSAHDALGNEQALYDKSMELTVKGQLNDLDSATINSYANLQNGLWTLSNQRTQQKNLLKQSQRASDMAGRYERKAGDLLSSFDEGGLDWQMYQSRIAGIDLTYDQNMDNLRDAYWDADYGFWDGVTDYFNGAQVGQAAGQNAASFLKDFGTFLA